MNTRSFRFQLTIWYTVAFFIATALIFVSFYLVTKRALFDQIDSDVTAHTHKLVEVLTEQIEGGTKLVINQPVLSAVAEIPGTEVVITDEFGQVTTSSLIIGVDEGVVRQLYDTAVQTQKPFFANKIIRDTVLRFLVTPVSGQKGILGVLMVGHPISEVQESLETLVLLLGIIFLVLIVPTIFGVYMLAYGAIQPILAISKKLKQISSENLDERVVSPKTGDEIEELALTFNHLLDRLSAAFARERQFISDVAHELKTPLATLRSGIEVALLKDRTGKEYKKVLLETLIDVNRLATTLKDVLDLAWSETDSAKTGRDVFSLSELVEELKDTATKMAYGKSIVIDGLIKKNVVAPGSKDKLFRALLNIVDNAVQYTSRGKIVISLREDNQLAVIKIKDTGKGILEKDLPHITERFYRGSQTEKTSGSGLGLAIAKAVINAHHGKIEIESKAGKGTQVTIFLPVMKILS